VQGEPEPAGGFDWFLLGFAALAWMVASAHFAWLGLQFVPTQAAVFRGLQVPTPWYLRAVDLTPPAPTRWLPFAVLAAPLAGLVLAPVALRRASWSGGRLVRVLAMIALAGTSATVLASFAVVQVTQAVYQRMLLEPRFQRP
jgi:hypothetical protein